VISTDWAGQNAPLPMPARTLVANAPSTDVTTA
jgi:hypothetical protein